MVVPSSSRIHELCNVICVVNQKELVCISSLHVVRSPLSLHLHPSTTQTTTQLTRYIVIRFVPTFAIEHQSPSRSCNQGRDKEELLPCAQRTTIPHACRLTCTGGVCVYSNVRVPQQAHTKLPFYKVDIVTTYSKFYIIIACAYWY